jgi:cytochrome c oxidase subunit IV
MSRETSLLLLTWASLMALLAITVAAALLPIGPVKGAVNIGAALVKAALIYWVFMHLRQVSGFLRVAAAGAALWIVLLGGMLYTDIVSRG